MFEANPVRSLLKRHASLLVVSTLLMGGAVAAEDPNRTMTVEQVTVTSLSVPASDLTVDLWTDRPGGVYADGERARVFVKVNQTARVELLDVGSTGVKTVLFPNACQPNNLIQAGQTVEVGVGQQGNTICPGIRVGAPYGLSVLKAVATTDTKVRFDAGRAGTAAGPFSQLQGSASDYARTMTVIVTQAPTAKWATTNLHYSVAPAATASAPASTATGGTQVTITSPGGSTVQVSGPQSAAVVASQPSAATIAPAYSLPQFKSDFGINVAMGEAAYKVGDTLSFSVTAERRCDLRVINVDHKGGYSILYPNALDETITLQAGKAMFLPRAKGDVTIRLSGEPGTQTLLAVCAQNKSFWETVTGRTAIIEAKPTLTLEEILNDKGDGLVGRKAVTYSLLP
ncbi:DUF4384 domain-containing protein [Polycyclovorans algicola]|uniref:DUF4384 domain-containing protein n=1 Tax=Polycyclovorans algicola TaxID=616992 RepID=UPI0004A7118D|nr:DUF4384 domain-containing protein [Polycyclovorans algicola]